MTHDQFTPKDYAEPKWDEAGKVHEWKNYVAKEVQEMWHSFTDAQRAALARQAEWLAGNEKWE